MVKKKGENIFCSEVLSTSYLDVGKYFLFVLLLFMGCTHSIIEEEINGPLFSVVPAEHSNIHFNNQIKDTKDHNVMIYSNYYGGGGVGIGDINNDGLLDIYFGGNLVGDKLYLNKGDMQFEDITESAGIMDEGAWSSGIVMADVNQDGYLDIYVTRELYDDNAELRKNKLYINNGDSTFKEEGEAYGVADDQRTRHASFLDYDKDGDLDLFLLNQPPNPGDYSKYYNTDLLLPEYSPKLLKNINGKFLDVSIQAGFTQSGFPNSITASDLNGDGWVDLYIANDFWVEDWYYINNGDGTFTNKILENTNHIPYFSMGVDAADINNDGALDVGIVDMVAEDNYRQKANMSGMNPEAFWKVVEDGGHHQYMFNALQMNTGDGTFSDIAQMANMANTDWSWSLLMADFNNDGWKDVHITNGLMRDIRNKDASKKIAEEIESKAFQYVQTNPKEEVKSIWDIIDIEKTLSMVPSEKLQNYVFSNNGDLSFTKKMEDWGMTEKAFSNGSAYGDLDNDGDLDLVLNNINDPALVYENRAAQLGKSNYLRIQPMSKEEGGHIFGTKVWVKTSQGNQFHEITGVRGMYSTSETTAHFGLADEAIVSEVKVRWPDGSERIIRNVDANQTIDVKHENAVLKNVSEISNKVLVENITVKEGWEHIHIENKFDDFRTQILLPHKMSSFGPHLSSGDVNGDDLEDVFIGGSAGKAGTILLQNTDGSFDASMTKVFEENKKSEDMGSAFFDADNDGDLDLYVVSGGNEFLAGSDAYQDRLYVNNGEGIFTKSMGTLPEIKLSGSKVLPHDFDKDGDQDLFIAGRHVPWAYPEPTSSKILRNENGKFVDATKEVAPMLENIGMVNDASWIDYDNDGWDDLVIVGEWMPITLLKNKQGQFEISNAVDSTKTTGWWFSVEVADMDNDGDQDILAGNLGLNYKYKASEQEPFEVYYYDFDGNSSKDIVLTYYNYGTQYPLRGKQCSSEQVPILNESFATYDLFASSDVFDVYGEDKLASALHYEAQTFASTYFENKGNGKFEAHPFENLAQISSINDFIVEDFNADNNLDILLAGNLYDAEVETTRADAGYGLILLGDGKGNFKSINKAESGIDLPYNVKSLMKINANQQKLILVGCNNDTIRVLEITEPLKN